MGHSGNWYPVGPIKWDEHGAPYQDTSDGQRSYIPPIAAAQYQDDPKMLAWAKSQGANVTYGPKDANGNPTTSNVQTGAPQGGFAGNYHWNGEQGGYEKDNFFDSSLGGLVLGASAVATPLVLGSLYGPAAASVSGGAEAGDAAALAAQAAEGAGAGGAAAAAAPTLAATSAVPATGSIVPATSSSMAAKGAAGVGSNIWSQILSGAFNLIGANQSANASKEAAQIQADAATKAAQLAYQSGQNTLDFQKSMWNTTQGNMAPFLSLGQSGARTLGQLMGLSPSGSGAVPIKRQAPRGGVSPTAPMMPMSGLYQPTDGAHGAPGGVQQAGAPADAGSNVPAYMRIAWPDGHADTIPSSTFGQYQLLGAKAVN